MTGEAAFGDAPSGAVSSVEKLRRYIKEITDFPNPGVSFKDITPLIEEGSAFHLAVDGMAYITENIDYVRILAADARGFVFGAALAYKIRKGLILARKRGKLPRKTILAGTRVLVVDDLLATGGTARAMCQLVEEAGGTVACLTFLVELRHLHGRERLVPYPVISLVSYDQ